MVLLKLVLLEGQRANSFIFKAHHPSTKKRKPLVGFEPRTEPEIGTGLSLYQCTTTTCKHEDSVRIVVIAVVHWCLSAEKHPCGNVVSAVIMLCLRFGRHGSLELDRSTLWSSRDMCVNWNEPQATAYNYTSTLALWTALEYELVDANRVCQGIQKVRVGPATRSAVATS